MVAKRTNEAAKLRVPEPSRFGNVALSTSRPPLVDMWITRWTTAGYRPSGRACFRPRRGASALTPSSPTAFPPLSTNLGELSTKLSTEICTSPFGLPGGGRVGQGEMASEEAPLGGVSPARPAVFSSRLSAASPAWRAWRDGCAARRHPAGAGRCAAG